MLEIRAPRDFDAPACLASRFARRYQDPRRDDFAPDGVVIDLRDCALIDPPAALWCVVYASLVRWKGIRCRVQPPNDPTLCAELAAQGFFAALSSSGTELHGSIEPRGTARDSIVFPISDIAGAVMSEAAGYEIQGRLQQTNGISANIPGLVAEIFFELINNALEHSESPVGRFATVQVRGQSTVLCTVADGGIGITESLGHNPAVPSLRQDQDAVLLALEEGITGTDSPTRGIGLNWVSNASHLIVHSGDGLVEDGRDITPRGVTFPGTLVLSICGGG